MFSKKVESTEYSSGKNILTLCCGFFSNKNRRQNSDEAQNIGSDEAEDEADGNSKKKNGLSDINGGLEETSALKPEGGKDDVTYASMSDTGKAGSVKKTKLEEEEGGEEKKAKVDENGKCWVKAMCAIWFTRSSVQAFDMRSS